MKHTLCDLQEKIFHLQIQLLEEDIAGGKTERERENTWVCVCGDVSNSSHLNTPVLKPFTFTHSSTAAKAANTYSVHQRKKKNTVWKAQVRNSYIQTLECSGWTVFQKWPVIIFAQQATLDTCTAKNTGIIVQPDIVAHTIHINGARFFIHSAQTTDLDSFHAAARS